MPLLPSMPPSVPRSVSPSVPPARPGKRRRWWLLAAPLLLWGIAAARPAPAPPVGTDKIAFAAPDPRLAHQDTTGTPTSVPARPTYSHDIAPLLNAHCVTCHRAGEVGPFALGTYADAKKRARMVAAVTESRAMPPWKPDPGFGDFLYARHLSRGQIATLARWAKQGAPIGNAQEIPPAPRFPVGWQLGRPDRVLRMPEAFPIPAEGRDVYQHFVFPLNLPRDTSLLAIEVRPGNRRVTHHAVGILDTSGTARKLDAKTAEQGYGNFGGVGFLPAGLTPGYVPGQTPRMGDEDAMIVLKPKMDFVLEMHYHPTGKPETDQTEVGLYFSDKKPRRAAAGILMASEEIDIPAGAQNYRIGDAFQLPADLTVRNLWAHMHMVGKKVRVWADLPDGTTRPMLSISDWDFNWQDTYVYREPFRLPRGTWVRSEWTYDNTDANPRNPNSPPRRVMLGENSTDEMSGLWVGGVADNWQGELGLLGANIGHYLQIKGKGDPYRARAEKARAGEQTARR